MFGTAPVMLGKELIYAYMRIDGRQASLRVSADECDRHDLFAGRQVTVGLSGREPTAALVTAVVPNPPFVWLEMELSN